MADEDDPIILPIEADVDDTQVGAQGDRAGQVFAAHFNRGTSRAGKDFSKLFVPIVKKAGDAGGDATDAFVRGLDSTRILAETARIKEAFDGIAGSAKRVGGPQTDAAFRELIEDMTALQKRSEATKKTLAQIGADPDLFAQIDQQLKRVTTNVNRFQEELNKPIRNPKILGDLAKQLQNDRTLIGRETAAINRQLDAVRQAQGAAANKINQAADRANQERLLNLRNSHGKEIAETQRAGSLELAEFKANSQKQLAEDQRRSRARIELARFTFRQIQVIERGFAGLFRSVGTIFNRATSAAGTALGNLGRLTRRSNGEFNEGLRGALIQRESSISRSFSRQTNSVSRELREQSIILDRFEAKANTGVVGALSGRSRVGTALGLGAGIGGGFALFQGLRNGFNVGGDFVQGLAVLGAQLELTDEQMRGVREQAIALGNDISLPGVSALDAAEAIQLLAKQFANLGDAALPAAQGAAKGVLQLSRAAGVNAEEAARVVGAAVNIFGVEATRAVEIADQVTNALTNAAGVGFNDFADSFQQAGSVFSLFVSPAEEATAATAEFSAAIAVLAKGGLIGSDAGTSLKQFFLQANRGTKDAKENIQLLIDTAGETGSLFFDADGNARTFSRTLDILRRGVAGLSDQARTTVFQKLFGSDAARAGAILVNLGGDFDQLTDRIQKAGSAANIAAAQNVGLRGALDALGSVIETQQIKTYEKYQGLIGKVVLNFANLLNLFFEGVGVMGVVRDALLGVAAALGALLVAKAAGEAFQFLALGLRAVLTPMGLFVTAVVGLGVLFSVFGDRVPALGAALDRLRGQLGGQFTRFVGLAGDQFERLGRIVTDRVVPALERFSVFAVESLSRGISIGIRFIRNEAIPALRRFAGIIVDDVLPPLQRFATTAGDAVVRGVRATKDALAGFANDVRPLIQPAIDGFQSLRGAIDDAFTISRRGRSVRSGASDLAAILPGVGTFIAGIGKSFANIGDVLIDAIRPQLAKVLSFLGDFLGGAAGTAGGKIASGLQSFLLGPLQQAVGTIGFVIGNIATDPRVIKALEQIAGLAVLTGVNFVKGVGKGIGDNLPALGTLIGNQLLSVLKLGLRKAFDPGAIARFIVSGVGAAVIGTALLRSMLRPTTEAGRKVGDGFVKSLATTVRTGFRSGITNQFAGGFFGGIARIEADAAKAGERVGEQFITGSRKAMRQLATLGVPLNVGFEQGQFRSATEQLTHLKAQFGQAQVAGATLRASFAGVGDGFRTVAKGIGEVVSGIRFDFADKGAETIRSGFGKMRASIATGMSSLRDSVRASGLGLGQALGGAIVSGVGAALAGQQLGTASGTGGKALGLAGIIASSLFAGASVGGGPQGALVGGAVLGIGLLTAAFADNGESADIARRQIDGYADSLKQFNNIAAASPTLASQVTDVLLDQGAAVRAVLQQSEFNVQGFVDSVTSGQGSLAGAIRGLTDGLGIDERRVQAFIAAEGQLGRSGQQAIDDLNRAAQGKSTITQASALVAEIRAGNTDAQAFVDTLQVLFDQGGFVFTAVGKNDLRDQLLDTGEAATFARTEIDRFFDSILSGKQAGSTGLSSAFTENFRVNGERVDHINQALDLLNQRRLDRINTQIDNLNTRLEAARTAADLALDQLKALFEGDVTDPFQKSLDEFIVALPNLAQGISDIFGSNLIVDKSQLSLFANQFVTGATDLISQAVLDNPGISIPDLKLKVLDPIITGLDQIKVSDGVDVDGNVVLRALSTDEKQFLLDQIIPAFDNPALAGAIKQVTLSQSSLESITKQIEDLKADLNVRVVFSATQIQSALRALNLPVIDALLIQGLDTQFQPQATDFIPGVSRSTQAAQEGDNARALAEAQLAARDQAESAGHMSTSADTLERAAAALEKVPQQQPTIQQIFLLQDGTAVPAPMLTGAQSAAINRAAALGGGYLATPIAPGSRF